MNLNIFISIVVGLFPLLALSRPDFKDKIPNGNAVPNPCRADGPFTWVGVGHRKPEGGGELNPFGESFHNVNMEWTQEFCQLDSDGDGFTNGEELGDANCTWTAGQPHPEHFNITNPAICEPILSEKCRELQKTWITVENCPVLKQWMANVNGTTNGTQIVTSDENKNATATNVTMGNTTTMAITTTVAPEPAESSEGDSASFLAPTYFSSLFAAFIVFC